MLSGTAKDYKELVADIVKYVTDQNLHGEDAWELMRNDPWPRGTIFKCKGLRGKDHLYIGLMPLDIVKGRTYVEWFMKESTMAAHFVWGGKEQYQNVGSTFRVSGTSLYVTPPKPADPNAEMPKTITYSFFAPEIFFASAKVLFFGVFKQYAPDLDWHEQPGGMDFKDVPLMPVMYTVSTNSSARLNFTPPMFPGTGYPAIGMEDSGPPTGSIDYYVVKNKHGLTVVTNNRDKLHNPRWESAYAGFFTPYARYEYPFPAIVVGGTSGIAHKGQTRSYGSGADVPTLGLMLDYRPDNWSLIHGVPSFACAGVDDANCPTQVMAMMPEGTWRNFANYVQSVESRMPPQGMTYSYPNTAPVRPRSIAGRIRPCEVDLQEYYGVNERNNEDSNERKQGYQMLPLELVENQAPNGLHILGRITNFYHASRPIHKYGAFNDKGTKYMILPNVWEDRKFHISSYSYAANTYQFDADVLLNEDKAKDEAVRKYKDLMNIAIKMEE